MIVDQRQRAPRTLTELRGTASLPLYEKVFFFQRYAAIGSVLSFLSSFVLLADRFSVHASTSVETGVPSCLEIARELFPSERSCIASSRRIYTPRSAELSSFRLGGAQATRNTFPDHFPLELSEGGENVQQEPRHRDCHRRYRCSE